jgi:hypothetical protein
VRERIVLAAGEAERLVPGDVPARASLLELAGDTLRVGLGGDRRELAAEELARLALPLGQQVLGDHEQGAVLGAVVAAHRLGERQLAGGLAEPLLPGQHAGALDHSRARSSSWKGL